MHKLILVIFLLALVCADSQAHAAVWQPSPGHVQMDGVEQSLAYYVALQAAGVPVEMHLYAQGGHAFGLRLTKLPIGHWPPLVEQWLHTLGVLGPQAGE